MITFLDSGSNLNRKTNRWLKVVVQDDFQTVQELKFNEISAIFIVDRSGISLTLVCYEIHLVIFKTGKAFLDKTCVYLRFERSLRNWLQLKKFQSIKTMREIPHLKRSQQIHGIGVVVNQKMKLISCQRLGSYVKENGGVQNTTESSFLIRRVHDS